MDADIIDKFKKMNLNVFPLRHETKIPLTKVEHLHHEKYDGSFPPSCNIGIMMGEVSGNVFVIDLDDTSLYEDWSEFHGKTFITESGKGYHIWFRTDALMPVTKRMNDKRGRHIDLQSSGTYVVAPTSFVIPEESKKYQYPPEKRNGFTYNIVCDMPILTVQPQDITSKLIELGCSVKSKSIDEISKGVGEGSRDHDTFAYTCAKLREGLMGEGLKKVVEELNQRHSPPLPQSDIDRIIKQAIKYEGHNIQLSVKKIQEFEAEGTPNILTMQEITPAFEGKMIQFDAMIIACGDRKSYIVEADYQCPVYDKEEGQCEEGHRLHCDEFYEIDIPKCNKHGVKWKLDRKTIVTDYIQRLKIQEFLDVAKFSSPISFEAEIVGTNVGKAFAGKRKSFVGKFRSVPQKDKYNVIVFEILEMTDLEQDEGCMPTEAEKDKWLSNDNIFGMMRDSIAPELYLNPTIKESLMLTAIGGKSLNGKREISHVALLGDAQTAKSDLLKTFHELIPGSGYVNGGNVSAAGLTIGMVKLHDNTMIPQGGVLPSHDGKPVIFDEIDKADKPIHKSLYECMEQGIVSSGKSGIGTGEGSLMSAKCSIMAGGNPIGGKFNPALENNIMDNFNLEETLTSRFDVMWIVRDQNSTEIDQKIIDTILNYENIKDDVIPKDELQRYFSYARTIKAEIPKEISDKIVSLFKKMRMINKITSISIGPRQFLGLNRLVTASAAAHLRHHANETDYYLVEKIIKESFGTLNIDLDECKVKGTLSKAKTTKQGKFKEIWNECKDEFDTVDEEEFKQKLGQSGLFTIFSAESEFQKYKKAGMIVIDNERQRWRMT